MRSSILNIAVGLFAGICSLAACDNTISPRADNAENVFAIYGFLDAETAHQLVKVSTLRATVLADPPSMEGVTVQSVALTTAEIIQWTDTTLASSQDDSGEFFSARFYPKNGESYVLQVLRNGVVLATARTTLPTDPILEVGDAVGDTTRITQPIRFLGEQNSPLEVSISYQVFVPTTGAVLAFQRSYVPPGRLSYLAGAWTFDVFLTRDLSSISASLGVVEGDPPLGLRRISMRARVQSVEYDQPTEQSNLDNAHGFFGSIGTYSLTWAIDSTAVTMMGYEDQQSVGSKTATRSSGGLDNQFEPF